MADILSSDGETIYMGGLDLNLRSDENGRAQLTTKDHLFSTIGFLDDSYFNRAYWAYGNYERFPSSGWSGYRNVAKNHVDGMILAFRGDQFYGFGRDRYFVVPLAERMKERFRLFGCERAEKTTYQWERPVPMMVRAMTLVGKHLFIAGYPDVSKAAENTRNTFVIQNPEEAHEAAYGAQGGLIQAIAPENGHIIGTYKTKSPVVFDGMIAAYDHLYLSTIDGRISCYGGNSGK